MIRPMQALADELGGCPLSVAAGLAGGLPVR